jgi:hypothetical protein
MATPAAQARAAWQAHSRNCQGRRRQQQRFPGGGSRVYPDPGLSLAASLLAAAQSEDSVAAAAAAAAKYGEGINNSREKTKE